MPKARQFAECLKTIKEKKQSKEEEKKKKKKLNHREEAKLFTDIRLPTQNKTKSYCLLQRAKGSNSPQAMKQNSA